MAQLDELFDGSLDGKMNFLNERSTTSNDGIYRVDLSKVKDKKRGWRSVVRFLPNLTKDLKVGESAIEKITHYVDIKNQKELAGWFDSPKNFGEKCPLTDLYYNMQNSKNAILVEKSKMLKYSRKYYSYVLVIEDEQNTDLVGKVMILQYGKTIKDKIQAEKNGEISGVSTNIFSLDSGKDFVLLVKEIQTGDETYPDYKMSMFKPETTSLPIFFKEKNMFKNAPLLDGKIDPKVQGTIKDFLLDREHELEEFSAKVLTEADQEKITDITNFLLGKTSSSFNSSKSTSASKDDFNFENNFSETSTTEEETEDDFFADL